MKTTHGEYVRGYNVEAAVLDNGFVVAFSVTNEANDASALAGLLAAGEKQTGCLPEELVADKGFSTPENLETLDHLKVEGYLYPRDRKAVPFQADEAGILRCLAGNDEFAHP